MSKKAIRRSKMRSPYSDVLRTGREFIADDNVHKAVEFQINTVTVVHVWWVDGYGWTKVGDGMVSKIAVPGKVVITGGRNAVH